jgi:hypothetical protein
MAVRCAAVAYKDFDCAADPCGDAGLADGHVCSSPWAEAGDPAGAAALRAFLGRLRADGGGDAEDAAGGLEAAGLLFAALAEPSARLCLLMTDAPCHGMAGHNGHDSHETFRGVDQVRGKEGGRERRGPGAPARAGKTSPLGGRTWS